MSDTGSYDEVCGDEHKRCFVVTWLWGDKIGTGIFASRADAHSYVERMQEETPAVRYLLMSTVPKEGETIEPSMTITEATPMMKWHFNRAYDSEPCDSC